MIEHMALLQPHCMNSKKPHQDSTSRKIRTDHGSISQNVGSRMSRGYSTSMSSYSTALGMIFILKTLKSEEVSDDRPPTSESRTVEETALIFMPWFYSRCIHAHYRKAFGSIQASFRTYPVISDSHPIWKMCETGNLRGLQAFFSDRSVSPFSINSKGMTLLHVSSTDSRINANGY